MRMIPPLCIVLLLSVAAALLWREPGATTAASTATVATGYEHSCALTADGGVRCWRLDDHGQLGNAAAAPCNGSLCSTIPLDVPGLDTKPTPTPCPPEGCPTPKPDATGTPTRPVGEVTCDDRVNSLDAAFILQYEAGLIASLPCAESADANADGATNSLDAALILQHDAGLVDSLPPQ